MTAASSLDISVREMVCMGAHGHHFKVQRQGLHLSLVAATIRWTLFWSIFGSVAGFADVIFRVVVVRLKTMSVLCRCHTPAGFDIVRGRRCLCVVQTRWLPLGEQVLVAIMDVVIGVWKITNNRAATRGPNIG